MTEELRAYYALALWGDYLTAKARADHAHGERRTIGGHVAHLAWEALEDERMALLAELRATPEHKAAFGW